MNSTVELWEGLFFLCLVKNYCWVRLGSQTKYYWSGWTAEPRALGLAWPPNPIALDLLPSRTNSIRPCYPVEFNNTMDHFIHLGLLARWTQQPPVPNSTLGSTAHQDPIMLGPAAQQNPIALAESISFKIRACNWLGVNRSTR